MKFVFMLITVVIVLTRCSDKKIEVLSIYPTDNLGNLIGNTPNDNQWKNMSLSGSELSLFNSLDTADLSGTQLPVVTSSSYGFPNPFTNQMGVYTSLQQPFSGAIVLKYVVVNKKMDPVQKGAVRIQATSGIGFVIAGNFSPGNYRLYFTYSAQGNEHFFKTWGNILKS
jgi:hypothetical protein